MIKDVIINYLPAFVLGFIFIFCTFRYMGTFKDMCDNIKEYSTYKKLEDHMKALLNENYEIKKDNKEIKQDNEMLKQEVQGLIKELKALSEEFELKLEHKEKEE